MRLPFVLHVLKFGSEKLARSAKFLFQNFNNPRRGDLQVAINGSLKAAASAPPMVHNQKGEVKEK